MPLCLFQVPTTRYIGPQRVWVLREFGRRAFRLERCGKMFIGADG